MINKIGITEQGDPVFDLKWLPWVKSGKPAILITKSPSKLYNMVECLDNINIIVHCTITGNGGTIIEPGVDDYETSLNALVKFVDLLGGERVVLRIDPIITNKEYFYNSKKVLDRANELLGDKMCRVRISFYDNYKHSKDRLSSVGVEFDYKTFNMSLEKRKKMWGYFGYPDVCGEQGIPSTPCLSEYDCTIFGVEPSKNTSHQRFVCECLGNKVELLKRTGCQCEHQCKYCYLKGDFKENKSII